MTTSLARDAADFIATASCTSRRPLRLLVHDISDRVAGVDTCAEATAVAELAARGRVQDVLVVTRSAPHDATAADHDFGAPHRVCTDAAAAAAMAVGLVDCVLVGAERVAANGDVVAPIGTYALALAAAANGIPFVVVCGEENFDPAIPRGAELAYLPLQHVTAGGAVVFDPALDATPAHLITAIVTDVGICSQLVDVTDRLTRPDDGRAAR